MTCRVTFSRRAQLQLLALNQRLAMLAGEKIADDYTDAIATFCQSLTVFPQRGTRRHDLRPELRVTNYRKRTVIAFTVDMQDEHVTILAVFHGGQDYETAMDGPED